MRHFSTPFGCGLIVAAIVLVSSGSQKKISSLSKDIHEKQSRKMSSPRIVQVTPDGKITKVIHCEGTGKTAKKGDKVAIHDIGKLSDGKEFDNSHEKGKKFKFVIGEDVIDGLSLAVESMKEGEHSTFTIAPEYGYGVEGRQPTIPPNATLTFEIEFIHIIEKFFNAYDAMKRAGQLKDEAAALFHDGKFAEAAERYKDALRPLKDWVSEDALAMKTVMHRNMAIACGKSQQWSKSLRHADEVLRKQKYDPKALLRRGEALIELQRFDEARETIQTGLEITHSSAPFVEMKKKLAVAEKPDQQRQNELYAKMFSK